MAYLLSSLRRHAAAVLGLVIIAAVMITAIFGSYFSPYDPEAMDLGNRVKPPAWMKGGDWRHFLGTDMFGKDVLSRLICGTRETIVVGITSSVIALVLGVILGMLSGYLGGIFDISVMRLVDIMLALPPVMIAIVLVAAIGPHSISIILAMGLTMWSEYAKVIRSRTLSLKEETFILASKVLGASHLRVVFKHILPNIIYILIVTFTLQIGTIILWATSLSFMGLGGVTLSWGWDISAGRSYISTAWWLSTLPGLAIFVTILGFNLFGEWLRDVLDPSLGKI